MNDHGIHDPVLSDLLRAANEAGGAEAVGVVARVWLAINDALAAAPENA